MRSTISHKHANGLDVGKFILAIFVIAVHTSPLKSISITPNFILVQILSRNAVPMFFMISGYFFYYKRGTETIKIGKFTINEYYYKTIKRLLAVYLVWSVVYLFDVLNRYYFGSNISLPLFILAYAYWATIYGTYLHLWFFPSVIFSLSILSWLGPKIGIDRLLMIAFGFYLIGMFGDSYFGLVQGFPLIVAFYKTIFFLVNTTRNGLLFALFFVTLGAKMTQLKHQLKPLKAGLYTLISLLFLTWEAFSLRFYSQPNDYNIMIGLIPTAYFGFQFLLGLDLKFKWDYKFIRDSSTVIFFSHPLFLIIFNIVFPLYFQDFTAIHSVIRFSFVFISSLLFSILVVKLRTHPKLSILVKYLY